MDTKLSRWGNSLAVRIPAQIASEAAVKEGVSLRIEFADGALHHLSPIISEPSLEEMVAAITDDNRHDEVDFGHAEGEESW